MLGVFASLLFVVLLGLATTTALNLSFSKPDKLETWLGQSDLYDHLVSTVLQQTPQTVTTTVAGRTVTITPGAQIIQSAAKSSFSPQLVQSDVNSVVESNYDWLEGKTTTPSFTVDFTAAKTAYVQTIAQSVQTQLGKLPACTPAQLKQLGQSIDTSTATCLPTGFSTQVANQAAQQIAASGNGSFGSTPITADTLIKSQSQSQPYYKAYSWLPAAYHWAVLLPVILAILAVLLAAAIVFVAPTKRRGLRRLASVLLPTGVILVLVKFAVDVIFRHVQANVFNSASVGQLQVSLTAFLHRVEVSITNIDLYFGIGFIAGAVIIYAVLFLTKSRVRKSAPVAFTAPPVPAEASTPQTSPVSNPVSSGPSQPSSAPLLPRGTQPPLPPRPAQRPPQSRGRLIQ